jgi:hypothetical protein
VTKAVWQAERRDIQLDQDKQGSTLMKEADHSALSPHSSELFEVISVREFASGGADTTSLLERCLARGWAPPEFYQALDELLQSNRIQELANGLFVRKNGMKGEST